MSNASKVRDRPPWHGVVLSLLVTALSACAPAPRAPFAVTPTVLAVPTAKSTAYILHAEALAAPYPTPYEVALIDAGSEVSAESLQSALAALGLGPDDVSAVLLTNASRERTAGVAQFRRATVYLGAADHALLRGDRRQRAFGPALLAHLGPPPPLHQRLRSVLPGALLPAASFEVEAFATPGVTLGAMCYRLGAILFTGDSLTACDRGLCTPGWFWSEQATATEDILKRIDRRGVTVIADGQGTVLADLAF